MNEFYVSNENDEKKYFEKNSNYISEENKSVKIYVQEEQKNDDDDDIISNNFDGLNKKRENENIKWVFENNLQNPVRDSSDKSYNGNEEDPTSSFFNINEFNVKVILRFLVDCCSFLCAVGIWGVLDEILIILSKENIYIKFYYYLIFTILFTSFMCSFNLYISKYEYRNNFIYNDLENQE
ncbi:conserved Plasmodium protein, unknown function [Plasmodium malariae]|uniref:Uncharacterized protein n=1 Tax=Plasmodium malariae TaxID=5858 RepID=A0A1C3KDD8_PLAMA|nr:conserved Plasmodium protein, unknown function [Plasmodium malariae]